MFIAAEPGLACKRGRALQGRFPPPPPLQLRIQSGVHPEPIRNESGIDPEPLRSPSIRARHSVGLSLHDVQQQTRTGLTWAVLRGEPTNRALANLSYFAIVGLREYELTEPFRTSLNLASAQAQKRPVTAQPL